MSDPIKQLAELEALLDDKMVVLLKKQNEILIFVDTDHKAKATKAYQKEIHDLTVQTNKLVVQAIEKRMEMGLLEKEAKRLSQSSQFLYALGSDLKQILDLDLARCEKKEAFDIVKVVGSVVGLAAGFVTVAKNTFDPSSSHATYEVAAGATTGLVITSHKSISAVFSGCVKYLCNTNAKICNSFALYYAVESAKDSARYSLAPLRNEKSFLIIGNNPNPMKGRDPS